MKKILIKIIKRKDAEAMTAAKSQGADAAEQATSADRDKKDRRLRREITETISKWIPEHKKNKRLDETRIVRKFFGDEPLPDKI